MKAYKKGYDDLKVAADEQYKKLEAFVNLQKTTESAQKADKVNKAN